MTEDANAQAVSFDDAIASALARITQARQKVIGIVDEVVEYLANRGGRVGGLEEVVVEATRLHGRFADDFAGTIPCSKLAPRTALDRAAGQLGQPRLDDRLDLQRITRVFGGRASATQWRAEDAIQPVRSHPLGQRGGLELTGGRDRVVRVIGV